MPKHLNSIDQLVATRMRSFRKAIGLTQTAVAAEIGVSFQQLQKYETGTNRICASRLFALSKVLQVPISAFFPDGSDALAPSMEALAEPVA
jgi:transcriptional regulator with XRE-family HTH domain